MTSAKSPDPSKVAGIAQKIVAILAPEETEFRQRAVNAALVMLGERGVHSQHNGGGTQGDEASNDLDPASFFERDGKLKPSDYAFLCAAYHFSRFGNIPFSLDEIREIASSAGVVIPDRVDMTLKNAAKGGKKLFQVVGRDSYRPTAAAGQFFKEKWTIKPGRGNKDQGTVNPKDA